MDPKTVKLTNAQKIKPLLRAINHEIPWQIVLIGAIALAALILVPTYIPVFIENNFVDFLLRRVIIGIVCGFITFLVCGLTIITLEEKFMPLVRRIQEQYNKEKLVVQKQVLDDVIDDEILK